MSAALRSLRQQRGVAAVELALLLIPLLIMTLGMTELGRAFYYYNTLLAATRDAARYLSWQTQGGGEAEARCLAVYGNLRCTGDGTALIPGLTTGMIHISYETAAATGYGSIALVKVTINGYPYVSLVPYVVADMVFGPVACTLRQSAS